MDPNAARAEVILHQLQSRIYSDEKEVSALYEKNNHADWGGKGDYLAPIHTSFEEVFWEPVIDGRDQYGDQCHHAIDTLKPILEGRTLVNLAGFDLDGVAEVLGVDTLLYINLYQPGLSETPEIRSEQHPEFHNAVLRIGLKAEMLDFVCKMPDGSADFTINGVDSALIGHQPYRDRLFQEIARATRSGGVVFGVNTTHMSMFEKLGFKPIIQSGYFNGMQAYVKPLA